MDEPLEAGIFHKIHCCSNLLKRSFSPDAGEGGQLQRRGQGRLLAILLQRDGLSMKEIVRKLDVRPSSAGQLVDKLVQQGLVDRRNDGRDKRVCYVHLTESGRLSAAEIEESMLCFYQELFSEMDEAEKQQLDSLLSKLKTILKEKYGYDGNIVKTNEIGVATGN